MISTAATNRRSSGRSRSIDCSCWATDSGANAALIAAWSRASLSSKTLKIVPSATPAAAAICFVVIDRPCSRTRGSVASMIAARRSGGDIGLARVMASTVTQ
jgi:hypothetical protein